MYICIFSYTYHIGFKFQKNPQIVSNLKQILIHKNLSTSYQPKTNHKYINLQNFQYTNLQNLTTNLA